MLALNADLVLDMDGVSHFNNASNLSQTMFDLSCRFYELPAIIKNVRVIFYYTIIPVLCFFGLLGNGLVIAVYGPWKKGQKAMVDSCVLGLMCWASITLVSSLMVFTVPALINELNYSLPYFFGIMHIARAASMWIAISIGAERFFAVSLPLKHQSQCTYTRGTILMGVISLLALGFSIPRFMEFETHVVKTCNGSDLVIPVPNQLRVNHTYKIIYILLLYCVALYAIPLLIIVVFNILIYIIIRRAWYVRTNLSRSSKVQLSTTLMLCAEAFAFVTCNTAAPAVNYVEVVHHNWAKDHEQLLLYVQNASTTLALLNCASHFVIFYAFGSKFRQTFHAALRNWRGDYSTYTRAASLGGQSSTLQHRRLTSKVMSPSTCLLESKNDSSPWKERRFSDNPKSFNIICETPIGRCEPSINHNNLSPDHALVHRQREHQREREAHGSF